MIKVIDGCGYNDRYWVFAGGLTNVETHLTVRDTQNPTAVFARTNPLNQAFAPILFIDAFDTCRSSAGAPWQPALLFQLSPMKDSGPQAHISRLARPS